MKRALVVAGFTLSATIVLSTTQVGSQSAGHSPLLCRGPIDLESRSTSGAESLVIHVRANPIGAGSRGDQLQPGNCAFEDRTFQPEEPEIIRWPLYVSDSREKVMREMGSRIIVACSSDPNCTFKLFVQNARLRQSNYFMTAPNVRTIHRK